MTLAVAAAGCIRPTFAGLGDEDASPAGAQGEDAAVIPDVEDGGGQGTTEPVPPSQGGGGGLSGGGVGGALQDASVDLPSVTLADAGVNIDAAGAGDGAVDFGWSTALEGSYARQIVSYGFESDGGLVRISTVLALSTIAPADAGGLELVTEACRLEYEWPQSASEIVNTGSPRPGAVTMRQAIHVGSEPEFALERAVLRFGFDNVRTDACTPGSYRVRYPGQVWLYALPCQCPLQPQTLPNTPDDCRLTDPDADLAPALTLVERSSASLTARYALAVELAFYGGLGSLGPDGVPMVEERGISAMGCVNASNDGCRGSRDVSCESTHNDFTRLSGTPTCSDVITASLTRFTRPPAPVACSPGSP